MAIGKRISFFRKRKRMTQKYLGQILGYPETSADIRIAQYESGKRTPKEDSIKEIAAALNVAPEALTISDIEDYANLMQTLFAIEDYYGLTIGQLNGELCLHVAPPKRPQHPKVFNTVFFQLLFQWHTARQKYETGQMSREEYDNWRYSFTEKSLSGLIPMKPDFPTKK